MGMIPEIPPGHRMQNVYAWHFIPNLNRVVGNATVILQLLDSRKTFWMG